MKRILVAAGLAAVVLGCSDNTLTIRNLSDYDIRVTFRAKEYVVVANTYQATPPEEEVSEVPNGTYEYGTVYSPTKVVAGASVVEGDGLSGGLTFERSETKILLIYGSAPADTTGKSIKLWGAWSSNQQSGGSVTAP